MVWFSPPNSEIWGFSCKGGFFTSFFIYFNSIEFLIRYNFLLIIGDVCWLGMWIWQSDFMSSFMGRSGRFKSVPKYSLVRWLFHSRGENFLKIITWNLKQYEENDLQFLKLKAIATFMRTSLTFWSSGTISITHCPSYLPYIYKFYDNLVQF